MDKDNVTARSSETDEQSRLRMKLEEFRKRKEEEKTRNKKAAPKGHPAPTATITKTTVDRSIPTHESRENANNQRAKKDHDQSTKVVKKSASRRQLSDPPQGPRVQLIANQRRPITSTNKPAKNAEKRADPKSEAPAQPMESRPPLQGESNTIAQPSRMFISAASLSSSTQPSWFAKATAQIGTPLPVGNASTAAPQTPARNLEVEIGMRNLQERLRSIKGERTKSIADLRDAPVPSTPKPKISMDAEVQTTPSLLMGILEQLRNESQCAQSFYDSFSGANLKQLKEDREFYAAMIRDDPFHLYLCQPIILRVIDPMTGQMVAAHKTPILPLELWTWHDAESLAQANHVQNARLVFQKLAGTAGNVEHPRVMFPCREGRRIIWNHAWQHPLFWIRWAQYEEAWGEIEEAFVIMARAISVMVGDEMEAKLFQHLESLKARHAEILWSSCSEESLSFAHSVESIVNSLDISIDDGYEDEDEDAPIKQEEEDRRHSPPPPRTWYTEDIKEGSQMPPLTAREYTPEYPSPPHPSAAFAPFERIEFLRPMSTPIKNRTIKRPPKARPSQKETVRDLVELLGDMAIKEERATSEGPETKRSIEAELEWGLKEPTKHKKEVLSKTVGVRLGPQVDGSTVTVLTPVRAKKKDRETYGGESVVLTPVRRSVRHFHEAATPDVRSSEGVSDQVDFESILQDHGYAYAPNPALPAPVSRAQSIVTIQRDKIWKGNKVHDKEHM
ncbi:hypothetical protein HDV00_007161 [Rhizophlyctis rosea]|nr:hypothetical protein HDV00_007161 [Rhizophlyctis rosea]